MFSPDYVWAKVINHMEERLGSVTVSTWFDDAKVVELTEDQLILYSPSDFRVDIIRRRCTEYIQDALKEIFNSDAKLVVYGDAEMNAYKEKDRA
jgi:chromosomal replication initiator protein